MTQMKLSIKKNRLTDMENRLVVAKAGQRVREGWLISRCKLLHIEQINKVLLYSIGSYIQYPVINHNGKEYKKGRVYFSSVQSLSHVQLFETPWTTARQASLSITNSQSLLKLMSVELVMPSNHLILCHPLLLFNLSQHQSLFQ